MISLEQQFKRELFRSEIQLIGYTTSLKLHVNDTIPSYKINDLKERFIEALLKKTEKTLESNESLMKK